MKHPKRGKKGRIHPCDLSVDAKTCVDGTCLVHNSTKDGNHPCAGRADFHNTFNVSLENIIDTMLVEVSSL